MNSDIQVHIFWEGHQILRNLHQLFVLYTASEMISEDFAKGPGAKNDTTESPGCFNQILTWLFGTQNSRYD